MAGTFAGTGMAGTGPAEGDVEAVAAGCSKAAGPAGSNHSHLAVHTEVASAAVGTAFLPWPLGSDPGY